LATANVSVQVRRAVWVYGVAGTGAVVTTTYTVLQFVDIDDDDDEPPVVHRVGYHDLPCLLGGADAAWWLLRFGWFGRRWVLVDHLSG